MTHKAIREAVALLPKLEYQEQWAAPDLERKIIIAALKEMPALLDEVEGLREALKETDAHAVKAMTSSVGEQNNKARQRGS